jgi:hypothetical protein
MTVISLGTALGLSFHEKRRPSTRGGFFSRKFVRRIDAKSLFWLLKCGRSAYRRAVLRNRRCDGKIAFVRGTRIGARAELIGLV